MMKVDIHDWLITFNYLRFQKHEAIATFMSGGEKSFEIVGPSPPDTIRYRQVNLRLKALF
jgi:hypothetical protein